MSRTKKQFLSTLRQAGSLSAILPRQYKGTGRKRHWNRKNNRFQAYGTRSKEVGTRPLSERKLKLWKKWAKEEGLDDLT